MICAIVGEGLADALRFDFGFTQSEGVCARASARLCVCLCVYVLTRAYLRTYLSQYSNKYKLYHMSVIPCPLSLGLKCCLFWAPVSVAQLMPSQSDDCVY